MDRRTQDSKQIGRASEVLRAGIEKAARTTELEYIKAERCRICGLDRSDLPHSTHVRRVIDRELMSNATYRGAIDAAEPFIAGWPPDQRPTYAAVRNHAKRHLNRDQALMRQLMETHAVNTGIDIEESEGPILTPGGVLAVIAHPCGAAIRAVARHHARHQLAPKRLGSRLGSRLEPRPYGVPEVLGLGSPRQERERSLGQTQIAADQRVYRPQSSDCPPDSVLPFGAELQEP
jgi:hypothetical protein